METNIEKAKERLRNDIKMVRAEAVTLIDRLDKSITALEEVHTMEDVEQFNKEHIEKLEDDLEHIELF